MLTKVGYIGIWLTLLTFVGMIACSNQKTVEPATYLFEADSPTPVPTTLSTPVPTTLPTPPPTATRTPEIASYKPTWNECAPFVIDFYTAVQHHRISLTKHRQFIVRSAELIDLEPDNANELKHDLGLSLLAHQLELDEITEMILFAADITPLECKELYPAEVEYVAMQTFSATAMNCRELDQYALSNIPPTLQAEYSDRMHNILTRIFTETDITAEHYEILGDVILSNYSGLSLVADPALCNSAEWDVAINELLATLNDKWEITRHFGGV